MPNLWEDWSPYYKVFLVERYFLRKNLQWTTYCNVCLAHTILLTQYLTLVKKLWLQVMVPQSLSISCHCSTFITYLSYINIVLHIENVLHIPPVSHNLILVYKHYLDSHIRVSCYSFIYEGSTFKEIISLRNNC